MNIPASENFLPTKEASAISGYNSDHLARLARSGEIKAIRVGRAWHVERESLVAFLKKQAKPAAGFEGFISTKEAAKKWGYGADYLARLARTGEIKGSQMGRTWLIERRSLEAFLKAQSERKEARVRSLASSRALEYHGHKGTLVQPLSVKPHTKGIHVVEPFARSVRDTNGVRRAKITPVSFIAKFTAGAAAVVVITFGALFAQEAVPVLTGRIAALSSDIASGFREAFGGIPARTAARVESVKQTASLSASRAAAAIASASENVVLPPLLEPDLAALAVRLGGAAQNRTAFTLHAFSKVGPSTQNSKVGPSASSDAYAFLLSPSRMLSAFANAPHALATVSIRADASLAYALAEAAPASARATFALLMNTGDALARAAERAPSLATALYWNIAGIPAHVAPAVAARAFALEYAGALRFVAAGTNIAENMRSGASASHAAASRFTQNAYALLATAPLNLEDLYLGALGKGALALEHWSRQMLRTASESPLLAAILPTLSAGEQIALATYETIQDLFDSASRALAFLFAPRPQIFVVSNPPPVHTAATSVIATTTRPTYTYTTVVSGISPDSLSQSLATLRESIIAQVSGMITPVSSQLAYDRIYDYTETAAFNGGSVGNDVSAPFFTTTDASAASTFAGTLSAGTTTLKSLTVTNTSSSTFAGALGIGTTSPSQMLAVQGNGLFSGDVSLANLTATGTLSVGGATTLNSSLTVSGASTFTTASTSLLSVFNNAWFGATATSTFTSQGWLGIGTSSPDALFSLQQLTNGTPFLSAYRVTDIAPSGDFISFKQRDGTTLFRVDNSGNLLAGGIINSGSQTITSVSTPQLRIQYDASNEITEAVNATGTTTIGINGTAPGLVFTPQSNLVNQFNWTDASSNSLLSLDTLNKRVGIGTTSPYAKLSIHANNGETNTTLFAIASSTASATTTHFVVTNAGKVGVGTSNPQSTLDVNGLISSTRTGSGNNIGISGSVGWYISVGTDSVPSLYIGGSNYSSEYFWRANWSTAGVAVNTFKTALTSATDFTTVNILGVPSQTGDLFAISGDSQTMGNIFKVQANGNVGIGTTSPSTKFSVGGAAGDTTGHGYFTGGLGVGAVNTSAGTLTTTGAINGQTISSAASFTGSVNAATGYKVNGAASSGTILRGNGTTYVASTATFPDTYASGDLIFASAANVLASLASTTLAGRFLTQDYTTGRPSWVATSSLNVALANTTGTLPVNRGGTGLTTFGGTNTVLYTTAADALASEAAFTYNQTTDNLAFTYASSTSITASGSAYFATASGNVGIGTTSPGSKLEVAGDIYVGTNASGGGLYFRRDDGGASARITSDVANTELLVSSNGGGSHVKIQGSTSSGYVTINPDGGNVGIGTTTPNTKLDVNGTFRVASTTFVPPTIGSGIEMSFRGDGTGYIASYDRAITGYKGLLIDGSTLALNTGSGGNVGIGTTAPGSALDVLSSSGATFRSPASTNNNVYLNSGSGTGAGAISILSFQTGGETQGYIQSQQNNKLMEFGTNGSTRMVIDTSGNVGIGTTSPTAMLTIDGGSIGGVTAGIKLAHPLGNTMYQIMPGITGVNESGFSIRDVTAGVNRFVIDTSGNVGIGSSQQFQVSSTGITNIVTGTGGPILYVKELGAGYGNANAAIVADTDNPTGSSNYLFQGRLTGTDVFSVRADGQGYFSGNVGIGTASPTNGKLEISGTTGTALYIGSGGDLVITAQVSGANTTLYNDTGTLNINTPLSLGSGTLTSGAINGQTISSAASFTGTVAIAGNMSLAGDIHNGGYQFLENLPSSNGDIYANIRVLRSKSSLADGMYINYGGTGGNAKIYDGGEVNHVDVTSGGNLNTNGGTITSGLINGQTISSAANFTGTINAASTITGSSFSGAGTGLTGTAASLTAGNTQSINGAAFTISGTTGTAYTSAVQVREANLGGAQGGGAPHSAYQPRLGFHWSGVVASSITMENSGRIAIVNNPGTSYENFIANTITGASFSGAGTGLTGTAASLTAGLASNLTGSPNITVGTITSGAINGQTISSAANFTGSLTVAGTFDPNGTITLPTTGISGAGSGSGLDADLWDGNQFSSYLNQAVLTSSSPTFNVVSATDFSCTDCLNAGDLAADSVGQSEIAASAVGTGELKTATASFSSTIPANVTMNDYNFFPNAETDDCASGSGSDLTFRLYNGNVTNDSIGHFYVNDNCNGGGSWDITWRYITASDRPTIWIIADGSGTISAVWQAEDPISQTKYPENPNPLQGTLLAVGQYFANPAPPSLETLAALYDALLPADRNAIIEALRSYIVDKRQWLESLESVADLASISERYEPAARLWAVRLAADHYGLTTSEFLMSFFTLTSGELNVKPNTATLIADHLTLRAELLAKQVASDAALAALPTNVQGADLGEWYTPAEGATVEAGDIIAIDPRQGGSLVVKGSTEDRSSILGIVSTAPDKTMGRQKSSADVSVALVGRVPVKVSTEGGSIEIGDKITLSSLPGIGAKATMSSQTVGIALEAFDGSDDSGDASNPIFDVSVNGAAYKQKKILVFVRSEYTFAPGQFAIDPATGQVTIGAAPATASSTASATLLTVSGNTFAASYEVPLAPATTFVLGTTTSFTAELPSVVLTVSGNVDLYKLATYNLSGITALADKFGKLDARVTSLEERVAALENSAALAASSTMLLTASSTQWLTGWLASAQNGIGDLLAKTFRASEKICVDDQCLTKDDVHALLELAHVQATTTSAINITDTATSTATTTPLEIVGTAPTGQADTTTSSTSSTDTSTTTPTSTTTTAPADSNITTSTTDPATTTTTSTDTTASTGQTDTTSTGSTTTSTDTTMTPASSTDTTTTTPLETVGTAPTGQADATTTPTTP